MMLIVFGNSLAEECKFDKEDDPRDVLSYHGKLPKILQNLLTKGLDFHQKEHLKKCRYRPNDWKSRRLKISTSESSRTRSAVPDVISINLAWQESSPQEVLSVLNMIPSDFKLKDMFELERGVENKHYFFRGMICFWGLHYF